MKIFRKTNAATSYERKQRFWNILQSPYMVHLIMAVALFLILGPVVWELITSIRPAGAVQNPTYFPSDPTLRAYYVALIEKNYVNAIVNSLIISSTTTVLVLALGTPAGYIFSRYRFPFDNAIFIAVILSRLFPPIGLIVPYYQMMSWLGLLDNKIGIILANVYLWLPLVIYMMRNFFMTIPKELDESARIDGCTKFQAFRKIVFPLALPGFAASTILTFLYSWREFLFAFMISSTMKSMPISVGVYQFVGDVNVRWAQIAAAGMIAIIPTVLIVAFFQKYIVSGLTGGALKG